MTERRLMRLLAIMAILLAVLGGVSIYHAAVTPWHTDSDAYFAGLKAINTRLYANEDMDFEAASQAFHTLQDDYRTPKWLYADLGYLAVG